MVLLPEAILMMMELVVSVRKEGCLLRNWVSEAGRGSVAEAEETVALPMT